MRKKTHKLQNNILNSRTLCCVVCVLHTNKIRIGAEGTIPLIFVIFLFISFFLYFHKTFIYITNIYNKVSYCMFLFFFFVFLRAMLSMGLCVCVSVYPFLYMYCATCMRLCCFFFISSSSSFFPFSSLAHISFNLNNSSSSKNNNKNLLFN